LLRYANGGHPELNVHVRPGEDYRWAVNSFHFVLAQEGARIALPRPQYAAHGSITIHDNPVAKVMPPTREQTSA